MTIFDASSELTMNVALFGCGALGYFATRWANRHLFQPRLPMKKIFVDDEEEACFGSSIRLPKAPTCIEAHEPESEPTVAAVVASTAAARRARRRSSRQAKAAEALAEPEATASLLRKEDPAEEIEAIAIGDTEEAEEAEEAKDFDMDVCQISDDVPIFDVSLPQPAAPLDEEEDIAEAEAEDEVEPVISDRVARLMAKKAARKQRKAEERRQLTEQLAAALAQSCAIIHEEPQEPADELDEEAEEQAEEADQHEEVEVGVELKAREAAEDEGADEVDTDAEASDKEEAVEELQADHSDQLQAVGLGQVTYTPILSPDGQQLYTDGQQVYIMACVQLPEDAAPAPNGSQEVDSVAMAASAATVEAPDSVVHAITDPTFPWHSAVMDFGVTYPAEESLLIASPSMAPMPAPPVPSMAMQPNPDMDILGFRPAAPLCPGFAPPAAAAAATCGGGRCPAPEEECQEDNLWDVCWEFVV